MDSIRVAGFSQIAALVSFLPVMGSGGAINVPAFLENWILALLVGAVGTALPAVLYFQLVKVSGPRVAGFVSITTPPITLAISWLLTGQGVTVLSGMVAS